MGLPSGCSRSPSSTATLPPHVQFFPHLPARSRAEPPGALVRPKDPLEYFRKLRFHQAVTGVRDYGIDA